MKRKSESNEASSPNSKAKKTEDGEYNLTHTVYTGSKNLKANLFLYSNDFQKFNHIDGNFEI